MSRQPTCAERIKGKLAREMEEVSHALHCSALNETHGSRDPLEPRTEYMDRILCIEPRLEYKITLSTGGPADGFYITVDPTDDSIIKITYWFQDWFDYAEMNVTDSDLEMLKDLFGDWVSNFSSFKWESNVR